MWMLGIVLQAILHTMGLTKFSKNFNLQIQNWFILSDFKIPLNITVKNKKKKTC